MILLLARRYGRWPHEVAALPFGYYLVLRDDYFREKIAERRALARARGDDETIEFDAEAAKSGQLAARVNESLDRRAGVEADAKKVG